MAIWQDAGSSKPHWVPCLIPLQNHGWKLAVRFCRMDIQPCESWFQSVRLYCFSIYFLCCSCPCLFMGSSQFRISCWCLPPWSFWLRMQPAHRPRHTLTEQQPSSDRECMGNRHADGRGPFPWKDIGEAAQEHGCEIYSCNMVLLKPWVQGYVACCLDPC